MPNINYPSLLVQKLWIFDLWPLRMTLTLTYHVQNVKHQKIHTHNKYQVSISTGSKVIAKNLYLTFDLEEWSWPFIVTIQNLWLYEIHLYTKYQMSISIGSKVMAKTLSLTLKNDLDLKMLQLKMCSFVRYMCAPNIKCLSPLDQKLWPMLKLSSNKQTHKQTGQKQHAPQILSGGIKCVVK